MLMPGKKVYIELYAINVHETEDAVLFKEEEEDEEGIWIPKSVLGDYPEKDYEGIVEIEKWFAINEELI